MHSFIPKVCKWYKQITGMVAKPIGMVAKSIFLNPVIMKLSGCKSKE